MRHAIVNQEKKVVNVIVWQGHEFLPPRNHYVVRHDLCDMGDYWDEATNTFHRMNDDGTMTEKSLIVRMP